MGWFEDIFRIPTVEDMIKPSTPNAVLDPAPLPDPESTIISNEAVNAYIQKLNAETPNIITAATASALKAVGDISSSLIAGASETINVTSNAAANAGSVISSTVANGLSSMLAGAENVISTKDFVPAPRTDEIEPSPPKSDEVTPTPTTGGNPLGLIIILAVIAVVAFLVFR